MVLLLINLKIKRKIMKTNYLKHFVFLVIGMLALSACEDSADITATAISEQFSEEELVSVTEASQVSDDIDIIVDDYFEFEEGFSSKNDSSKSEEAERGLDCVTKTIELTATTKMVTLDFGDGCELPNGNVLSGKIIMSFKKDTDVQSLTITRTFENFYHNDVQVDGEATIVKVRENEEGNPQSTNTFTKIVTWPDGEVYRREGTKVKEWIEGYDTRNWGDDVYLTTGSWQINKKNGTIITAVITTPLRKEFACRYLVSGVIALAKDDVSGTLDFGDGTCDNVAIFTNSDGEEREIILRKRKRN
jgi:hypothetical protein